MNVRKATWICIIGLVLFGVFSTLREINRYPALEAADPGSMELLTTSAESFKIQYPAETWEEVPNAELLTLYYTDGASHDGLTNMNVQQYGARSRQLTEADKIQLEVMLKASAVNDADLQVIELRKLNGRTVIYIEQTAQVMIPVEPASETGNESSLTAHQIGLASLSDGYLYIYTGTYFADEEKQIVLEALTIAAQTTQTL